jgi:hypothetical protein
MTKEDIKRICDNTKNLLIKKNEAYGDSALNPLGIFGNGDAVVSLGARMDDKLMRLKSLGINKDSVDTLYDLHGYITLLIIALERKENIDSMDAVCQDDTNTSNLINQRDNAGTGNTIQEYNEHAGTPSLYTQDSTGAYQDWQVQILDREGPWGEQRRPVGESSTGQDS